MRAMRESEIFRKADECEHVRTDLELEWLVSRATEDDRPLR